MTRLSSAFAKPHPALVCFLTAGDGDTAANEGLLHFRRSGGWECLTNLSNEAKPLPAGEVLLSSAPLTESDSLPAWTTVWLRAAR